MQFIVQFKELGRLTSGFHIINEGLYPLQLLVRQEGSDHPDRQPLHHTHQIVNVLNILLGEFGDPGADIRDDLDEPILFKLSQGLSDLASRYAEDVREMNLHESLTGFKFAACNPGFKIFHDLLTLWGMIPFQILFHVRHRTTKII